MRVLIIADFRDWAFGHISKDIKKFNQDESVDINVIYLHENGIEIAQSSWAEYDVIFIMGWYLYHHFSFIPKNKVIVGINAFCKWDFQMSKGSRTFPPTQSFIDYLSGFSRISVISQRLLDIFSKYDLPDIYYTPNAVDCDLFHPKMNMPDKFTVGAIAKSYRRKLKRVDSAVVPSAQKSQVEYKILSGENDMLSHEDMPDFYNSLSCHICASMSEGFSIAALEAAACGRPVISTDVGGVEEIIIHGETGFVVNMSIDDMSDKINLLKNDIEKCKCMGDNMRRHIVKNYSWQKVIPYWMSFLKGDK